MIFVTVGTTIPFDDLLREVDRLAATGFFGTEPILCQGGQSRYTIRHGEQFKGRPDLDDLIRQSSFVITHGGLTAIQVMDAAKPFVAFPNPRAAGDHQAGFLTALANLADISWSRDVADMARLITHRRRLGPSSLRSGIPRAATLIADHLQRSPTNAQSDIRPDQVGSVA